MKEKAEREFERGYKKASMLSAEELDKEIRERHSLRKDDPYSLGMYQYYKELRR